MEKSNTTARDVLLSIFSDVYKDVHGFRPRGTAFPSDLSDEEIQAELDGLQAELDEQLEEKRYKEDYEDRMEDYEDF